MFLSLITSKLGLSLIAVALVVAVIGVHLAGDAHVKHELAASVKVADDLRRDLKTCRSNTQALTATLDAQNASIAAAKADGDRRAKMLADGLQQARVGRASAEARAARLVSQGPVGVDACARSEAARVAVLESLK